MRKLYTMLTKAQAQLGVVPICEINLADGGVDILVKWKDEGSNEFSMERFVSEDDLAQKPIPDILSPLSGDIQDLLDSVCQEKREIFLCDLLNGVVPTELPAI